MIIDVGVLFEPSGLAPLRRVSMVVPAKVVRVRNLAQEVRQTGTAQLIFGRRFKAVDAGGHLDLWGLDRVAVVDVADKLDAPRVEHEETVVRLLTSQVPPSGLSYLRVRLVVDGGGSMWRWRWVAGRRDGALIDFRVHDPREGGALRRVASDIVGRDKPIPRLDAFFMLPDAFQIAGANPRLEYTRTLEPDRWLDYLDRRPTGLVFGRERILVHRWKEYEPEGGVAGVDKQRPYRGYLQFNRRPAVRSLTGIVGTALVTALILLALLRPLELRDGPAAMADVLADVASSVGEFVQRQLVGISAVAIVVLLASLFERVRKIFRGVAKLKRAAKRVEFLYFQVLKSVGRR